MGSQRGLKWTTQTTSYRLLNVTALHWLDGQCLDMYETHQRLGVGRKLRSSLMPCSQRHANGYISWRSNLLPRFLRTRHARQQERRFISHVIVAMTKRKVRIHLRQMSKQNWLICMTLIERNVYPEHLDDKQVGTHVAWHGHMHKVYTLQYGAQTLCGP